MGELPPPDMRKRVRDFDWSRTPLGPMSSWPQSLRTAVSIVIHSRFPMFVWWGPERINIYNDAYAVILGKRHPDALGRSAQSIWSEIWDVVGPQADLVFERGESTWNDRVLLVMERQGYVEHTWFTWSYSPIHDETGKVGGLFCACTEETARVIAERDLAESKRRYQALATAGAQVLYRMSPDWRQLRALDGQGFLDDTLQAGENWLHQYVHPDDHARVMTAINEAVRTKSVFELEHRVRRADGSLGWAHSRAVPLLDDRGEVVEWIGAASDVTERHELAERFGRQSRLFEQIASTTPDFIYVLDLNARFIYANKRLLDVWGKTWEEANGKGFTELGYPQWHAEMHQREIRQVIETKKPVQGSVPFTGGSGISGVYEYIFTPVLGPDGEVEVIAGTTRDVTERERLLAAERQARADAERVSRMKDEFLATLSHELRTPLNAIYGWSRILASGGRSAQEVAHGLEIIERNAKAQTQIIEDLLEMSRIISGKVRLEVQPVDLPAVIRAAIDTVRPAADARGVRVNASLEQGITGVSGDPNRLQQVFWNLLSNAVKFTPSGGRVDVMLARVGSQVQVSVADTGEGIRPEFLPHVFDRFSQADPTTTRRHGGLGLGLAIVKQLVELHGGSVRATSDGPDRGSTFIVTLPRGASLPEQEPDTRVTRRTDRHGAVPCIAGVRLVVVDDEPDARSMVRRLLEGAGATVRAAGSAAEALQLIASDPPDLLISDIGMPQEDGFGLIRRLRESPPERGGAIPAIALTAYARTEDRIRTLQAGYQAHVIKPLDPAELITAIAALAKAGGGNGHPTGPHTRGG